jgi:hypothetical protein
MNALGVKLRSPRVLIVITVAVLVFSLLLAGWHHLHPSRVVNAPYLASIIEIRKVITYPKTATFAHFGSDPRADVRLRHDGDYEVTGWVEQTNDSGHRDRLYWLCVLHPQGGDHYLPVYVHVGPLTVGTYVRDTP